MVRLQSFLIIFSFKNNHSTLVLVTERVEHNIEAVQTSGKIDDNN